MGSLIGGAVGSYYGGPIGGMIGSMAGAQVDNWLFAPDRPKPPTPNIGDLTLQDSTYGAPRPRVWGKFRLPGQVVWKTTLVPVVTPGEDGGKGGAGTSTPDTTAYYLSFAVMFCDTPPGGIDGFVRLYFNKKLVWQGGTNGLFDDKIVLHLGGPDELPDSTIEAHEGIGNVPAYRRSAYVVCDMIPVGDYGNQQPQVEAVLLSRTNATLRYDGAFEMKTDAPATIGGIAQWSNLSEAPDRFGNAVFFSGKVICISPAGDTVWTRTAAQVADDINTFAGATLFSDAPGGFGLSAAAIVNTVDDGDEDQAQKSHVLVVGIAVKSVIPAAWWTVSVLYECVATGDPILVGWYRQNSGPLTPPHETAGAIFVGGNHSDQDPIFVTGSMSVGGLDVGWRLVPSVSEFVEGVYNTGTTFFAGDSHEIVNVILYWSGTGGLAYRHAPMNAWVVPHFFEGSGENPGLTPHLCLYLSYGWMQSRTSGSFTNPETRDVLQPAYPNGCVVDINLREASSDPLLSDQNDRGGTYFYYANRALSQGSATVEIGRTYAVINADFTDDLLVQQLPFDEEGRYSDGTGSKGITGNSYEQKPTVVRIGLTDVLVMFQRLGNLNTTDTLNKNFWPLEVRAFRYKLTTGKFVQIGHERGYIYSKDELGTGSAYPEDNGRMLWPTGGQLYVWGMTGGSVFFGPRSTAYLTRFGTLSLDGVCTLARALGDLCIDGGYSAATDFDVSDVEDIELDGFAIGTSTTCLAAIDTLLPIYDCYRTEEDDKIVFRKRTDVPIADIAEVDLGTRSGDEKSLKMDERRGDQTEAPASLTLQFIDPARDLQPNAATDRRNALSMFSRQDITIQAPVVMTAAVAKPQVRRRMYDEWRGRTDVTVRAMPKYGKYSPGDPLRATYENGATQVVFVAEEVNHGVDGVIEIKGRAVDAALRTLLATASAAPTADPTVTLPEAMTLIFLDVPVLRDEDDTPGYYLAAHGASDAWNGGVAYESSGAGGDFAPLDRFAAPATYGTATTTLAAAPNTWLLDTANVVRVTVARGTLSSAAYEDLENGANRAMLGDELIAYMTATPVSAGVYDLSGLLRGLVGSDWAMGLHATGERFVAIAGDGTIKPETINLARVGALRHYRGVSIGGSVATVANQDFTPFGVRIKPLAPCQLDATRGTPAANDLVVTFAPRVRVGAGMHDGAPTQLDEPEAVFEVDIFDGINPDPIRTIDATATVNGSVVTPEPDADGRCSFVYDAADQVADFGSVQSSIAIAIYQLSGRVGRGYPASATV